MKKFNVIGMSCASCSARVEKAVKNTEGVTDCSVNLLTNSMIVDGTASESDVIAAVINAGYGATLAENSDKSLKPEPEPENVMRPLVIRLISSLVFMLALMYISMGYTMWGWPLGNLENYPAAIALIQLLLTAIVMVINQKFFISGFKSVIHRALNMDTLVSMGAAAAFIYSTAVLFKMLIFTDYEAHYFHDLYFESAAMILTLITLGKLLESYSKGKTTNAIKGLMELAPSTAVIERNGREVTVPVEQVKIGDVFVLRPGSRVPVDGKVIDGNGAVDESALTGESMPVDKKSGDAVSVATTNMSGFMRCRATKIGEDTTLSQIIKMVSDASGTKAPIAKIADKVSGVFVPIVIIIAVVTVVVWLIFGADFGYALARGISVLVISCPCALGLATPVAVMVGSGIGAKNGILYKTAASLENTGKIKTAVFDKTGTITNGTPCLTDVVTCDGVIESELMSVACSLEQKSEHPIAKAILEYDTEISEVTDFKNIPGGIVGKIQNSKAVCGNFDFVSEYAQLTDELISRSISLTDEGKTVIFVAKNGLPLGIIAVADVIKPDSKQAIKELKDMGIKTVMLTGDNKRTANAIAAQVGIDKVIAGVLPAGKEKTVRELKNDGLTAMIGDGINDAPALTTADVGIAIGAGTDIAVDAADIVLVNSRLSDVSAAVRLSRAALRTIHQNLFWAFIYNAVGIPLASGMFAPLLGWELTPMFASAAMSLSSFCVVSNALRLNLFKVHKSETFENKKQVTLKVSGMMCVHCENTVKTALERLDGVVSAVPSYKKKNVIITLSKPIPKSVLRQTIESKGYKNK